MWLYEAKLQYDAKVSVPDPRMAQLLIAQYGGPNGELAAAMQYLNQRFDMENKHVRQLLIDIGTEELAHLEIIGVTVRKLLKGIKPKQARELGIASHYVEHENGLFYVNPAGNTWTADYLKHVGDPIADITSNIAAEERARAVYEHLISMTDDPCVQDTLRFLRERELVHAARFQEALYIIKQEMYERNQRHLF
jgi:spore coat protein JC